MAKFTPNSIREQVVRVYEAGLVKSYAEAGAVFGVGEATFNRIYRLYRTTGSIERKP
ncbi:MAG: hypothetical protein GY822_00100 [Deltaproteobacteria bacterium]|nr:hypothetical protein [Deltaproteobacteria bacterium]